MDFQTHDRLKGCIRFHPEIPSTNFAYCIKKTCPRSCNQHLSWEASTTTPWLSPGHLENPWFAAGLVDTATFDVDASAMDLGQYAGQIVYKDPFHASLVVNVNLIVVDQVFSVYLPATIR